MNTCKTCKFWKPNGSANPLGLCYNLNVTDGGGHEPKGDLMSFALCGISHDTAKFETGPDFGCIHHQQKE